MRGECGLAGLSDMKGRGWRMAGFGGGEVDEEEDGNRGKAEDVAGHEEWWLFDTNC